MDSFKKGFQSFISSSLNSTTKTTEQQEKEKTYEALSTMFNEGFNNGDLTSFNEEKLGGRQNLVNLFTIVLATDYTSELNETKKQRYVSNLYWIYKTFIADYQEVHPELLEIYNMVNQLLQTNKPREMSELEGYLLKGMTNWAVTATQQNTLSAMMSLFMAFNFFTQESFDSNYSADKRYMLKCIFANLPDADYQLTNFEILSYLECLLEEVMLKFQSGNAQAPPHKIAVYATRKNIRDARISSTSQHQSHLEQLKSLTFNPDLVKPAKFFLETISNAKVFSKSVIICISGFTSEDCLKAEEWIALTSIFPNSEIMALNWSSNKATNVLSTAYSAIKADVLKNSQTQAQPQYESQSQSQYQFQSQPSYSNQSQPSYQYQSQPQYQSQYQQPQPQYQSQPQTQSQSSGMSFSSFFGKKNMFETLVSAAQTAYTAGMAIKNNVWDAAYQQAITTGIYLAHLLGQTELFRGAVINLVGFSLGTLVIATCLKELVKMGRDDVIYDVLLMGGVANIADIDAQLVNVIGHKLFNCYSAKDSVLAHILSLANPGVSPVGLGPITYQNPKITNLDVTEIAQGHLKYRESLVQVLGLTTFNQVAKKNKVVL